MIEQKWLSRTALLMLILSSILVSLPHIERLPLWTIAVVLACLVWRYMIFLERWRYPGFWIRAFLVFIVFGGVFVNYGTLLGPEVNTTLLINAIALKMIEMFKKRDAFLIVMLNYFVVAMAFLFSRGVFQTMYIVFATVMVTAVLVSLQRTGTGRPKSDVRVATRIMLHSIPLMILMFVMIPRIGPLWSIDLGRQGGKLGMSEFMSPGDISNLARNGDIAFRVEFEGEMPPSSWLYWRGMTLNDFDGRRWSSGLYREADGKVIQFSENMASTRWYKNLRRSVAEFDSEDNERELEHVYNYTVTMEATNQPWLFALKTAIPSTNRGIAFNRDYRISRAGVVDQTFQYKVKSYSEFPMDTEAPPGILNLALTLPDGFNPKTVSQARQWRAEAKSNAEYMERVLRWFNQENFHYTLKAPALGKHTADEFLFGSRKGFCEHYAGSFVILMRAAGIPARVVVGYLGGELSEIGDYMLVHQYDAHAWTEVWFEGDGWVRVDPTGMVAAERIDKGLEEALSEEDTFLQGSGFSMVRFSFLDKFRMALDYIDYAWAKWVLGYDNDMQIQLLTKLLGSVTPQKMLLVMAGVSALFMLVMVLILYIRRPARHHDAVVEAYLRLLKVLKQKGLPVEKSDTPADIMDKSRSSHEFQHSGVAELLEMFITLKYVPAGSERHSEEEFVAQAKRVTKTL